MWAASVPSQPEPGPALHRPRATTQTSSRIDARPTEPTLRRFFGERLPPGRRAQLQARRGGGPPTELVIGGTRFALLPTRGGETGDALLVHLPDHGVLFVGDILMPYFGAPFAEEGSVEGLLAAIEQVYALKPRLLLHGHEPLTRVFGSTAMLDELRAQLAWLRDEVLRGDRAAARRARAIQQANLMPPTLGASPSSVHWPIWCCART